MELKYTKANYGRVVIAGLLDAALIIAFFVYYLKAFVSIPFINENPNLSILLGFIFYRLITIVLFNATFGMRMLGLTFLKDEEENLTLKDKFLAGIFILFEDVDYYRAVRADV